MMQKLKELGVKSLEELEGKDLSAYFRRQRISGVQGSAETIRQHIEGTQKVVNDHIEETKVIKTEHQQARQQRIEEIKARKANERQDIYRLFNKKVDGLVKRPEFNSTVTPPQDIHRETFQQHEFLEHGKYPTPWEADKLATTAKFFEKSNWKPVNSFLQVLGGYFVCFIGILGVFGLVLYVRGVYGVFLILLLVMMLWFAFVYASVYLIIVK